MKPPNNHHAIRAAMRRRRLASLRAEAEQLAALIAWLDEHDDDADQSTAPDARNEEATL
jgi:hypothetical protein